MWDETRRSDQVCQKPEGVDLDVVVYSSFADACIVNEVQEGTDQGGIEWRRDQLGAEDGWE